MARYSLRFMIHVSEAAPQSAAGSDHFLCLICCYFQYKNTVQILNFALTNVLLHFALTKVQGHAA